MRCIAMTFGLLVALGGAANLCADVHHTIRLKEERHITSPKVNVLAFSPDGSELAVGTNRGTVFVSTADGNITHRLPIDPFSMAYCRDGSRLHLISRQGSQLVYSRDKSLINTHVPRQTGFLGVRWENRNGKILAEMLEPGSPAAESGQLNVGDELIGFAQGSAGGRIQSLIGRSVASAVKQMQGPSGTWVRLQMIRSDTREEHFVALRRAERIPEAQGIRYATFTPVAVTDDVVWCTTSDGFHELRCARTAAPVSSLHTQNVRNLFGTGAISNAAGSFAWVGRFLEVPDEARNGKRPDPFADQPSGDAGGVAGSAFDRLGLSRRTDYYGVEIFDISRRELVTTFPIDIDPVSSGGSVFQGVHFANEGRRLVVGTITRLHVYDVASGAKLREIEPRPGSRRGTVISTAAARHVAATGDRQGIVRLFDINSGELLQSIDGRVEQPVSLTSLSPDARWLAFHTAGVLHVVATNVEAATRSSLQQGE